jgi:hypothetical protein
MEMEMAHTMGVSRAVECKKAPASWTSRIARALGQALGRHGRARRIDEQTWSGYMLRDIGLDEGGLGRGRDPRDLPFDWPLR